MNIKEVMGSLELKFTSSNSIPVDRATILAEEYQTIKNHIEGLKEYHKNCHDCGQFIIKRLWVSVCHKWKKHALCTKCLFNYDESD